jgi:Putative Flp pilus-assembly TadE/G-like
MKALTARAGRQRGVVLIMYAVLVPVILGFAGLVLDLGLVYLRRAQLQSVADSMAIGAAIRLDGTMAGVFAAEDDAAVISRALPGAARVMSQMQNLLRFSRDPNSGENGWLPSGSVNGANVGQMLYARVDMGALEETARQVQPVLAGLFGRTAPFDLRPVAVAGRRTLNVMPLAICAFNDNSPAAAPPRESGGGRFPLREQVSYGFRQGVTYNLLKLNPKGNTGLYYFVDPLSGPDAATGTVNMTDDVMAPFMCSGTVAYPRIGTGKLKLSRRSAFGLARQINSRLNVYGDENAPGSCTRYGAPPDANIMSYADQNVRWMKSPSSNRSAKSAEVDGALKTVADRPWATLNTFPPAQEDYGTLWAFHSAKKTAGGVFTGSWDILYPSSSAGHFVGIKWPEVGPYFSETDTTYRTEPDTGKLFRKARRLMHIPLLSCVPGAPPVNEAPVLAYGRFFLTAPATDNEVPGEFGGFVALADEFKLRGEVELLR